MKTKIICTSCNSEIAANKKKGKIIGSILGSGAGAGIASGLGIAGAVAGMTVAAPATLAGVLLFGIIGNRLGNDYDRKTLKCRNCQSKSK